MILEDAVVNEQARAGYRLADGGTLEIRAGSTVLAVLTFNDPAFGAPRGGTAEALPLAPEKAAPATGTADNFRVLSSDGDLLWSGTAGGEGSGADMEIDNPAIQRGTRVELDGGLTMTVPRGAK